MPVYEYTCEEGHRFERLLKVEGCDVAQFCDVCGEIGKLRLSAPMIINREISYQSPIDGKPIYGKRERADDLARSGCVEYDPMIRQDIERNRINSQNALDSNVDRTIDMEIEKMSGEKRDRLARELESGADLQFGRA